MKEITKRELSWKGLSWHVWGPIFQNEKVYETYSAGIEEIGVGGEKDDGEALNRETTQERRAKVSRLWLGRDPSQGNELPPGCWGESREPTQGRRAGQCWGRRRGPEHPLNVLWGQLSVAGVGGLLPKSEPGHRRARPSPATLYLGFLLF